MWRPIGPQSTGPRVTSTVGLTPVRHYGQPPPPPSGGPRTPCSRFGRQDHVGPLVCLRLAPAIGTVEQAAHRPGPSCWMHGGPSGNRDGLSAACDQTCRPGTRAQCWRPTVLARRGEGRNDGKARRLVTGRSHWRHTIAVGALLLPRATACAPLLDPKLECPRVHFPRGTRPGAGCASLLSQRLIHSPQCGRLRSCTRHRPESSLPSLECA